jgi:hypothetical protein
MQNELHEVAWESGHRVPTQLIPIECVPENVSNEELDNEEARKKYHDDVLEAVRWIITYLSKYRRPAIALDALTFATGLMILEPGRSETSIAEKHGISRQAFSKLVTKISKQLNLTPSRGMKSRQAREAYRVCQIERRKQLKDVNNYERNY